MHIIYFGVMCVGSPLGLRVRDGQKKEKCVTQRRKEIKANQTYLLFLLITMCTTYFGVM